MRNYEITLVGFNEAVKVFEYRADNVFDAMTKLALDSTALLDGEKDAIVAIQIEEVS